MTADRQVRITTATQSASTSYKVTVASSVKDTVGRGIDPAAHLPQDGPQTAPRPEGTPERSEARERLSVRNHSDVTRCATGMPTFRVTSPDGTVATGLAYRPAMIAKLQAGPGATITPDGTP